MSIFLTDSVKAGIKFGITLISALVLKCLYVSLFKLSETAVTIFDWFKQKVITGSNDLSFPTNVMSVPCKVVIKGILYPSLLKIRSEERRVGKECRSRW